MMDIRRLQRPISILHATSADTRASGFKITPDLRVVLYARGHLLQTSCLAPDDARDLARQLENFATIRERDDG